MSRLAAMVALAFIAAASGAETPAVPPSRWIMLGPLANPELNGICEGFERDSLAEMGGEASARPREGNIAAGGVWARNDAVAIGPDGAERIDLISIFGQRENRVAYLYKEIEASAAGDWAFAMGSDDGLKVWLNGRLLHANHVHRALIPGEDLVIASMERGANRLLVKVDQGSGGWEFSLRALPLGRAFPSVGSKLRGLSLVPASWRADPGAAILCNPMTIPPSASNAPIVVELLREDGSVAASVRTKASRPAAIIVPPELKGLCHLRASGSGPLAGFISEKRVLIVGRAAEVFANEAAAARAAAKGGRSAWFDAASSLEFAATVMEGRTDPSLCSIERKLQAIAAARDLRAAAAAPRPPSGALRLAFRSSLDGTIQPYSLCLPSGMKTDRRYPLLVLLHGKGGDDMQAIAPYARAADAEFIVLSPFGRGDFGFQGIGEADVLEAMAEVMARYPVDPDRVHIAGSSMGGYGALRFAQLYADRFASAASFAGWTGPQLLMNLHDLPLLLVHGDADDNIPVRASRSAAAVLKDAECPVELVILPGAGHNAFDAWSGGDARRVLDRARPIRRNMWPPRIRFAVSRLRYGKHYWAEALGLEAGKPGFLDVSIDDARHLSVETKGIEAFALDLRHPRLAKEGRIVLWVDGSTFAVDSGSGRVGFKKDGRGRFVRSAPLEGAALNGGGGIPDLFLRPLYVVYGTGAGRDGAELRRTAELIGDLGPNQRIPGGARSGKTRVIADSAYDALSSDPAMKGVSAIFVGNPASNSSLRKVLALTGPDFPLSWKKGALALEGKRGAKVGAALVHPYPGRPGALMAAIDMPLKQDPRTNFFLGMNLAARVFAGFDEDPSGPAMPDLIVLDARGVAIRADYYDAAWKELRPAAP